MLRARLLDEDPGRVPELHRRARAWYDANGDPADAIAHAMAGGDVEGAARLIELAMPQMRRSRQDAALPRWLEDLPEEVFTDRPVLSYVREFEHVTLARPLVARHAAEGDAGALDKALTLLDRLLAAAEDGHRIGRAVEILILQAAALHDAPAGRVTGFVGPNGAGKSTTMRMMVGLTGPTPARSVTTGSTPEHQLP